MTTPMEEMAAFERERRHPTRPASISELALGGKDHSSRDHLAGRKRPQLPFRGWRIGPLKIEASCHCRTLEARTQARLNT
jgi:hypothetical protein